jgi:hypothetical protein
MGVRTISIKVARTIQVERFEPVQVEVHETIECKDIPEKVKAARAALYADVTKAVASFIGNEKLKYAKKKREDDDD